MTLPPCPHVVIAVDASEISDSRTFHNAFLEALGFPHFYGRNMSAWIDCMTDLDDPEDGLSTVQAPAGGIVVLKLDHAEAFAKRCPEIYAELVECAAFVNWRRLDIGQGPILVIAFHH